MRILIINTVPTDKNGITNVIFNLHKAMDKQDLVFDYVSINEPAPSYIREIEAYGGQVFVISRSIRRAIPYVCKLVEVIRQGQYDVVHAHGNSSTLVLEMLAAKLAGCKVRIAHSHNTTCLSLTVHKLLNPLFQMSCTHGLACGVDAGKWLFGDRPFTVVNNGVDTERFAFQLDARQGVRRGFNLQDKHVVIGHVGAFNNAKNQEFLLDVLSELAKADDNYRLLMIGDGPLQHSVQEKTMELHLTERVIFAGATDRVEDYLSACDLIVMPSRYEGLPLSLVEEQASGLYCVVSENITQEVDKTGNLTFLPLSMGGAYWAQVIREIPLVSDREKASMVSIEKIKASGYDIQTEVKRLKEYYISAVG